MSKVALVVLVYYTSKPPQACLPKDIQSPDSNYRSVPRSMLPGSGLDQQLER